MLQPLQDRDSRVERRGKPLVDPPPFTLFEHEIRKCTSCINSDCDHLFPPGLRPRLRSTNVHRDQAELFLPGPDGRVCQCVMLRHPEFQRVVMAGKGPDSSLTHTPAFHIIFGARVKFYQKSHTPSRKTVFAKPGFFDRSPCLIFPLCMWRLETDRDLEGTSRSFCRAERT